jgi:hypothetical protein
MTQFVFPYHLTIGRNHGMKACVYEEACGSKKVSLRRTKQKLSCHIAGYLSQPPSEETYRNGEHHDNVEGAGNIDSAAGGDSAHICLSQNVCRGRI